MDELIKSMGLFFLVMIIMVVMFLVIILPIAYYGSFKESQVYNRINGTNFTAGDFFWAGDQINSQSQTINLKTPK